LIVPEQPSLAVPQLKPRSMHVDGRQTHWLPTHALVQHWASCVHGKNIWRHSQYPMGPQSAEQHMLSFVHGALMP
jgi:hypothetical protein